MNTEQFLEVLNSGREVEGGSAVHRKMHELTKEAREITCKLNGQCHTDEEIRALFSELTGKPIAPTFALLPPFYTECGKNITVGKNVFINANCCFQDHGGITIGDGTLIGHAVVIATLNHNEQPKLRKNMIPRPVILGKNVWVGAHATILSGVSVGDNAIVAAGAVVTKDVPKNAVVAGVPAKVIKFIEEEKTL